MTISIATADPVQFAAVITAAIALTHTGFNVANTIIFLPFIRPYTRLLERLIPDRRTKEITRLKHVDAPGVSSPVLDLEQSRGEVVQMGASVLMMSDWIRQLGFNGPWDERLIQKTYHREEILDNMQREVVQFLTDVLDATVPYAVAEEGRKQLRIAHEYESISDRLASILRNFDRLRKRRLELAPEQHAALKELHEMVSAFTRAVANSYATRRPLADDTARTTSADITAM